MQSLTLFMKLKNQDLLSLTGNVAPPMCGVMTSFQSA